MPEFVMEGRDHAARAESEFVFGFIEAMFFTESSQFDSEEWFSDECQEAIAEGRSDGELPGDVGYSDIHPDSLVVICKFCESFEMLAHDILAQAYERDYDAAQAGRDLWFTSQGHGVGYWDRPELKSRDGYSDDPAEYKRLTAEMRAAYGKDDSAWQAALDKRNALESESIGEKLSDLARYHEAQVWFGDHVDNGNAPFVYFEATPYKVTQPAMRVLLAIGLAAITAYHGLSLPSAMLGIFLYWFLAHFL